MKYSGVTGSVLQGMHVLGFSIEEHVDSHSFSYHTGHTTKILTGKREISMSISLVADSAVKNIPRVGAGLLGMGDGKICPFCSTYWPDGNYMCWNCGGLLQELPLVKPINTGGVLSSMNMKMPVDGVMTLDLTVEGISSLPWGHLGMMSFCDTMVMGYYRCEWCGLAVEDGKACYGCGGPRTPLAELVDMQRECSWCGSSTINGIVCEACGTRVTGRTIGDVLGE